MRTLAAAALGLAVAIGAHARTPLTGDVTLYAAPNAPGDCLSPETACSPAAAWARIRDELDLACHRVTVELEEGTYRELDLIGALTGACTIEAVTFRGNVEHPERVRIQAIDANAVSVHEGAWVRLEGLELASSSADFNLGGHGLIVWAGGRARLGSMAFGDCTSAAIDVSDGAQIQAERAALKLTGFTPTFALAEDGGRMWLNGAWISLMTPYSAFAGGMFRASRGALIDLSGTILNLVGGPLFGYIAVSESNATVVLLGMRYPGNMGQPQRLYGGQIVP